MIITLEKHIVDLKHAVSFNLDYRVLFMSNGQKFQATPKEAEEIRNYFYHKYVERNIEEYEKSKPAVKKAKK